jgi:phosphoadenosine phosphosulfate reductase
MPTALSRDAAILHSGPEPGLEPGLAHRLATALAPLNRLEDRLAAVADAIPGRVAFSTSLGLEDQAILHAIAATGRAFDVFSLDTGRHFPETLETLEASEQR